MKNSALSAGVIILFLIFSPVFAFAQIVQKGIHEPGTGLKDLELKEPGQGSGQGAVGKNAQAGRGQEMQAAGAAQRRSLAAGAFQEMLEIAERNQGVGERIRNIAQAQNQNHEQIESAMEQVRNRGRLKKFFFGPDYKSLKAIESSLASHADKLAQLKELALQMIDESEAERLQKQISVMEKIEAELEGEAEQESKGFSLFGWLARLINRS